ncbi:hypothetical protein GCM10010219_38950 [Streptomyces netropsis]|nr:hypothetical protein GCM10010219_38950 [Streptomyces netropsis]
MTAEAAWWAFQASAAASIRSGLTDSSTAVISDADMVVLLMVNKGVNERERKESRWVTCGAGGTAGAVRRR